MVLVVLTLFSILAVPVSAARFNWTKTGRIPQSGYSSGYDIYTDGEKAKVRICTFNQAGDRKGGKITVKIVGDNGQVWYQTVKGCNGPSENSTNITLPKGNTHYKISIKREGDSNSNRTNCFYFSIDLKSHCWWES